MTFSLKYDQVIDESHLISKTIYDYYYVKIKPNNYTYPSRFIQDYDNVIKIFECKDDDLWIASFPKCGTTWTQEMVWNIINHLDFKTAQEIPLNSRVPFKKPRQAIIRFQI